MNQAAVVVAPADAAAAASAQELARALQLPFVPQPPQEGLFLLAGGARLELCAAGPGAPGPVCADWVGGPLGYRRSHGGGRGQALARAVGARRGATPGILDATAGLGRDAVVLATLGCRVTAVERSPVLHALLEDALRRAQADPELAELLAERLVLVRGDARALLDSFPEGGGPQVVYLDPMHPPRRKSALVRKEMRILRALVGEDEDAAALHAAALRAAVERVVVKRPAHAAPLAPGRARQVAGRTTRYDVYLPRASS